MIDASAEAGQVPGPDADPRPKSRREKVAKALAWSGLLVLLAIVLVFAAIRVATDLPLIVAGDPAVPGSFEARYVDNPVPAYLHILPGVGFLVGALFQLSRGFRERHRRLHRRMGPFVLGAGLISGLFALIFGLPNAFGGTGQAVATGVFGSWFLLALFLAYAAIRRGDVRMHRQWMIRALTDSGGASRREEGHEPSQALRRGIGGP